MSALDASRVAQAYVRLAAQGKARYEHVRPERLRATQDYLHDAHRGQTDSEPPQGVRTGDGAIHLYNGHHRGDAAIRSGKTLAVSVVDFE
jgi:hypothetical protein